MKNFGKGSELHSVLKLECPRCHNGDLFLHRNPYNLKMLDKMPGNCQNCSLDFEREAGFYYGAMMISHAITTVIAVIVHLTVFHFYGWEIAPHLIILLSVILSLFPLIFRVARAVWINIFIKYNPNNN